MIREYVAEIEAMGGVLPSYLEDPQAIRIAKLSDVWRSLMIRRSKSS